MAFGNASAERAAIELTYEDTATVSRTTSQRGKNNISTSSPSVIYDGIICALSYTGSDNSRQTDHIIHPVFQFPHTVRQIIVCLCIFGNG